MMSSLRKMAPAGLLLAMLALLAAGSTVQGQKTVYRVLVLTRWNVTSSADLQRVSKIEEGLVFPCKEFIIRGVMGYTANLTGLDTASYAKIYDFTTMDQYDKYRVCSNAIKAQTDAWQVFKARIGFQVASNAPLPAAGKYVQLGIGNATTPATAAAQRTTVQKGIGCLYTTYGSSAADAKANTYLRAPTNTAWWAGFAEAANVYASDWYYVSKPAEGVKLAGYYKAPYTSPFAAPYFQSTFLGLKIN